ncbi:MAG: hypothetical protein EZS28_001675 [Streblomastix strix]|uniref:Uncharacterized protein n=1 Tax=Streblomastix strix TaxID=222440 RepID=A0A5J4X860_9EUKA|nr:MAG: hypothetical protein EZS28_001675 [Streblomastix strix]
MERTTGELDQNTYLTFIIVNELAIKIWKSSTCSATYTSISQTTENLNQSSARLKDQEKKDIENTPPSQQSFPPIIIDLRAFLRPRLFFRIIQLALARRNNQSNQQISYLHALPISLTSLNQWELNDKAQYENIQTTRQIKKSGWLNIVLSGLWLRVRRLSIARQFVSNTNDSRSTIPQSSTNTQPAFMHTFPLFQIAPSSVCGIRIDEKESKMEESERNNYVIDIVLPTAEHPEFLISQGVSVAMNNV